MSTFAASSIPDVFSAAEVARAAGVSRADVHTLIEAGQVGTLDGRLLGPDEAIRAVRFLRGRRVTVRDRELFRRPAAPPRAPGRAVAGAGTLHGAMLGLVALLTSGVPASAPRPIEPPAPSRLVFLATPGPGGGGGGGGLQQPAPPPEAEMKGRAALRSPVPPPKRRAIREEVSAKRTPPPPPRPAAHPVEPPPVPPEPAPLPQVAAPVATIAADAQDRAGVLESAAHTESNGPGSGGGAGTGQGTGMGEGDGSGIGPGSGGGTGGGPYRPGSGITPPGLLREVKPDYSEAARRASVEGDVVLEIVVRSDGSVGAVRVLHGLGAGLDERAVEAVRQWLFSPARRFGTPVDVMVEVAVEFKLR